MTRHKDGYPPRIKADPPEVQGRVFRLRPSGTRRLGEEGIIRSDPKASGFICAGDRIKGDSDPALGALDEKLIQSNLRREAFHLAIGKALGRNDVRIRFSPPRESEVSQMVKDLGVSSTPTMAAYFFAASLGALIEAVVDGRSEFETEHEKRFIYGRSELRQLERMMGVVDTVFSDALEQSRTSDLR